MWSPFGKIMFVVMAALFLSGCASPSTAEPTLGASAIMTRAAETAYHNLGQTMTAWAAQITPTQTATQTPTVLATATATLTPLPIDSPTDSSAASSTNATGAVPCNRAYLIGENYSTGATVPPGSSIVKDWFLYNGGTCTWTTEYQLIYFDGATMGSALVMPLLPQGTTSVPPKGVVHVTASFIAPATPGTYISYWKFRSADGHLFGEGDLAEYTVWVKIISRAP